MTHQRFHVEHAHLESPFGRDWFGRRAEGFARFFGTPKFLIAQSILVAGWIAVNAEHLATFDPYPFILLNLVFSLQAAYAAPLILLAQTRQADREKARTDADARHREDLAQTNLRLLEQNTELTRQIDGLTQEIHAMLRARSGMPGSSR